MTVNDKQIYIFFIFVKEKFQKQERKEISRNGIFILPVNHHK